MNRSILINNLMIIIILLNNLIKRICFIFCIKTKFIFNFMKNIIEFSYLLIKYFLKWCFLFMFCFNFLFRLGLNNLFNFRIIFLFAFLINFLFNYLICLNLWILFFKIFFIIIDLFIIIINWNYCTLFLFYRVIG